MKDTSLKIIIQKLESFITIKEIDLLHELELQPDVQAVLVFPTDDVYLTEKQYRAIQKLVPSNEKIHSGLVRMMFGEPLVKHYCFDANSDYQVYRAGLLDGMSFLYSDNSDWIVLIDENSENGEALFIGSPKSVKDFSEEYGSIESDRLKFEAFYQKEFTDRNVSKSHLNEMLKLTNHKFSSPADL